MIKNNIRPYEISLWTLQDSFISVLKPLNSYNKGQLETPRITIKNDGTQELNFSVPMYYRENGKLVENPIWYDIKQGVLLVNLRKIKVIFNKGEREGEEIFEFIINKITETHSEGQLFCEVTADGLAFQELGKIGYKISLIEDTYLDEYNEWWESEVGEGKDYPNEEAKKIAEPLNNINYWCDKVFKNSKWTYSIQMDWSIYDGIINNLSNEERENLGLRRTDKIYEEEYISSWSEGTDEVLVPAEMVAFQEKARLVNIEKSNIYNITQTLAETFGVYCKYKYYYDENYHIIGRECIFYNNFLDEKSGKIDINYPYDSSKIEREMDSADVVTKMFVVPIDDDTSPSGLITIADVAANKLKEDYILNFDYLYSIGTITEEQYGAISDYERSMYLLNTELAPISTQIAKLQSDLTEYKAQQTIARESQTLDKDQMAQSIALLNSLTNGTGTLEKTKDTPYRGVLLPDSSSNNNTYYIKISQEGVIDSTVKIYYYQKTSDSSQRTLVEYNGPYSVDKDTNGNVYRISKLITLENSSSNIYYLTFTYQPRLHYENIYNTFAAQLSKDEAAEKEANLKVVEIENKLKKLEEKYKRLLEEKRLTIADFENLMGPAIKEGSWQADSYNDYGSRFKEKIMIGTSGDSKYLHFLWDETPFEEEQLNYYEASSPTQGLQGKVYYPCVDLSNYLNLIKDNLNNLSVIYGKNKQYVTIGSGCQFGFLRNKASNLIIPVLIITKLMTDKGENNELQSLVDEGYLGVVTSAVDSSGVHTNIVNLLGAGNTIGNKWIGVQNTASSGSSYKEYNFNSIGESYTYAYPRLKIESLLLKTTEDEFSIKYYTDVLRKFYDYSILIRDESYYITLNNAFVLSQGKIYKELEVLYKLSNASLAIYLDALEVSKTNAFPKVSYTIEVSGLNKNFIKYAYQKLNKIVSINDADLKFNDVQGYISELDLNLDNPWEDEITIQNYKTKFEDLFSSIVASTEQMKANSFSYDMAAGAFTSNGTLKPSVIQGTIGQVDLTYAFNSGNLTIDEVNGIWATSEDGVVAMRGGGIFCATQKDTYGNWIWNTGITPSGINASLLHAGQIDTNLIKIYAGDNLRLQLNEDGLFAYRSDAAGEAKLNEYVVHNSDGLFLVKPEKKKDSLTGELIETDNSIKRVEISWNGLILRNNEGKEVFYADPDTGNLVIAGGAKIEKGSTIAGWIIEDNYLQSKDGNALIRSGPDYDIDGNPIEMPYTILSVRGTGDQAGVFKVDSNGTLYANNAIIKGTVSAGSLIGSTTVNSLVGAVKKIDIISFNEDCFRHYNPNLDGVITADPSWLRFQIRTNGLTEEELSASLWEFYYCNASEYSMNQALSTPDIWAQIDTEADTFFSFDRDYLTFIVKDDIMINGEDLIYLKAVKAGKAIKLDENGNPIINNSTGKEEYDSKIYEAAIQIRNLDFGTDKFLSLIEPPSYTFIGSQEKEYPSTASFTIQLRNINSTSGTWNLGSESLENENVLVGNSEPKTSSIKMESFIAVPEVNLENGKWFIDDILVENGDTINADDEIETLDSSGNLVLDGTKSSITITNVDNGDGTGSSTIIIPQSKVPEGGQIILRYTIVDEDNNISATRIAYVFKIKNGTDSFLTHISSTNGTIFKNGAISTVLEAELYVGITRLNAGRPNEAPYFYVWQKKEEGKEEATILQPRTQLYSKFLNITNDSFKNKAVYICDIYNTEQEALTEYNRVYGEESD